MTRTEFLDTLKIGLSGLPASTIADIVADYDAHFADGAAEGRSEAEVARALGEPERLARELRTEAGMKRWEDTKTPSSALGALFALLGLGAIDILILLPIVMGLAGTLAGTFIGAIGAFFGGGALFAAGPWMPLPGGPWAPLLGGLGLMAGSVAVAALVAIFTIWFVNALVWYGRLHYRLLKPALDARNA